MSLLLLRLSPRHKAKKVERNYPTEDRSVYHTVPCTRRAPALRENVMDSRLLNTDNDTRNNRLHA